MVASAKEFWDSPGCFVIVPVALALHTEPVILLNLMSRLLLYNKGF